MTDNFNPGELGAFRGLTTPRTQMKSGGAFYYTTGGVVASLSQIELEQAARFYAYLMGKVPMPLHTSYTAARGTANKGARQFRKAPAGKVQHGLQNTLK